GDGPVDQCTDDGWTTVIQQNLNSVFFTCRAALPLLRAANGGAIVNVGSILGMVGGGTDFATHAYAASKAGIFGLTRAMATYYAPERIRVNAVAPGLIATQMSRRAQSDAGIRHKLGALQPLTGEFGSSEDVAEAIAYLATAKFVTGVVLPVDGGWTAQ